MSNYTHKTAPTQFVEAAGIRFAYEDRASEASYKPQRFGSVALETVHRNDRNTKQRNP